MRMPILICNISKRRRTREAHLIIPDPHHGRLPVVEAANPIDEDVNLSSSSCQLLDPDIRSESLPAPRTPQRRLGFQDVSRRENPTSLQQLIIYSRNPEIETRDAVSGENGFFRIFLMSKPAMHRARTSQRRTRTAPNDIFYVVAPDSAQTSIGRCVTTSKRTSFPLLSRLWHAACSTWRTPRKMEANGAAVGKEEGET